jgi:hypothetical protein
MSTKGPYTFCTREELAGQLPFNTTLLAYRHTLEGACGCGDEHRDGLRVGARPTAEGDPGDAPKVVARYNYHDANGELVYQMLRFEPKSFAVRRPDGQGGWLYNLDGIPWVPYRLPTVLAADPTELVFIVEGEKDVKRLERAGLVATTNPFGAGKWRLEFSRYFTGGSIVILSDNDEEGERHAQLIAGSLLPVAAWVKWVKLPGLAPGGDVSDWLAAGKTIAELRRIVNETPPLSPLEGVPASQPDDAADGAADDNPWSKALPAPAFLAQTPKAVTWLVKDLLARGAITIWAAPRGIGKTHLGIKGAVELAVGGVYAGESVTESRVLYLNRDNPDATLNERLQGWGAEQAPNLCILSREDAPPLTDRAAWARFPIDRFDAVIVDSLISTTEGVTEKEGRETTHILATLRDLAAKNVAILLIHHPTKDGASVRGRGEWMACADLIV